MRSIAIVGAGQSGLQLGIGLIRNGYDVTIYSDRTGEEISNGFVMSSQCMFHTPLQYERELGLGFWDETCPDIDGISLTIMAPGTSNKAIDWASRLHYPAKSVDQRIKMPRWIKAFEALGGRMIYKPADIDVLEGLAKAHDLVIIASGKGEVGKLFKRDAARSSFDKPMRALGLVYVHGMETRQDYEAVNFSVAPGIGEFFVFPAETLSGPCHIWVFEGIPDGAMDGWPKMNEPLKCFEYGLSLLKDHFPHEAERCAKAELTDAKGVLVGRFPPTVKRPVGELPSGAIVYGMADCVMLNDPITGQGANNASRSAHLHLDAILTRKDKPFNREWMEASFEANYAAAKTTIEWTNSMLTPPPDFRLNLLGAAGQFPALADRIVNNFNSPDDFAPWWFEQKESERIIASYAA